MAEGTGPGQRVDRSPPYERYLFQICAGSLSVRTGSPGKNKTRCCLDYCRWNSESPWSAEWGTQSAGELGCTLCFIRIERTKTEAKRWLPNPFLWILFTSSPGGIILRPFPGNRRNLLTRDMVVQNRQNFLCARVILLKIQKHWET